MYQQAKEAHARRDWPRAIGLYRDLLRRRPKDALLLRLLGAAELAAGDTGSAARHLASAVRVNPRDAGAWADLSRAHLMHTRLPEAVEAAERSVELDAKLPGSHYALAQALCALGRTGEAERNLAPAIEAASDPLPPELAVAWSLVCQRNGRPQDALRRVAALADEAHAAPSLLYAIAELHETAGDYERAWGLIERANRAVAPAYDAEHFAREGRGLLDAWRTQEMGRLPRAGFETERPLFIVGLPRAGLGLVEQILAAHPQVHASGVTNAVSLLATRLVAAVGAPSAPMHQRMASITQQLIDRAGAAYLTDSRQRSETATRVVDRLPGGFTLVGWIRSMLPGARIIHVVRDTLDTAASCYTRNAIGRPRWTYDLRGCGEAIHLDRVFMDHWASAYPDEPVHTICYEQIIEDPDRQIRNLVEQAGLPWDDACLRFYESDRIAPASVFGDIRRPIHARSVGRAEWYRPWLGPLIETLGR